MEDIEAGAEGWIELENRYEDPRAWEGLLPADPERYELKPLTPRQP